MKILRMISVTAGRRHGWYEAEDRGTIFKIKKPLGIVDLRPEPVAVKETPVEEAVKQSWWMRLLIWLGLKK